MNHLHLPKTKYTIFRSSDSDPNRLKQQILNEGELYITLHQIHCHSDPEDHFKQVVTCDNHICITARSLRVVAICTS